MDQHPTTAATGMPAPPVQPSPLTPEVSVPAYGGARETRAFPALGSPRDRNRQRRLRIIFGHLGMLGLDIVMLNLAFLAAYYVRYSVLRGVTFTTPFIPQPISTFRELELTVTVGVPLIFWLRGLYRLRATGTWFKQLATILGATTAGFAVFSAYGYIFRSTDFFVSQTRTLVAFTWIAIIVGVSLARLVVALVLGILYRRGIGLTNLLVVGSGRLGKLMMQQITASPYLGYRVVGFIHDLDGPPTDFGRFKALGAISELDAVIRGQRIADVIIALPSNQHQQILRTVRICDRAGATFKLVPDLYELSLSRIDVDAVEGIPLIGLRRSITSSWQYRSKRLIDVIGAGLLLALSAPLWALIALAIKLDTPGPVLLRQRRVGYRGEVFNCFKFRSMHVNADQAQDILRTSRNEDTRGKFKMRHDPRRTNVGRVIRRMSIDELPQLLNVLAGDMSLVGPRPPLPEEYARYEDWEKGRLEMLPGITGLWQVRGRSDIDFDEMVLMDLYYIENWSLRLDLQILLQTFSAVLSRRGAY